MNRRNLVLLILDGWGHNEDEYGNAIRKANTPIFDKLIKEYPHTFLETSGNAVGLPEGQMGTSEANHMVIGAGRIIFQDLERINQDIKNERIRENKSIVEAMEYARDHNSTLHLQGLLGDGGIHSMQSHWYAMLSLAKSIGVKNVVVHIFTDGKDTPLRSAIDFIKELEEFMDKINLGRIASITGRYYAMDRTENWDRIEKAYDAIARGSSEYKYSSSLEAIQDAYERGQTDEFVEPMVIEEKEGERNSVGINDTVIFLNFRSDRAKEITKKYLEEGTVSKEHYVAMTQYSEDLDCKIAFPQEEIRNTLGEMISNAGLSQLRISESEKFNHVTYFFNCRKSDTLEGEDRILLDSLLDTLFAEKPEMRARDIAREIVQDVAGEAHNVIVGNICNADMVGHTGNFESVVKGVEVVDECIGKIYDVCKKKGYNLIITADHGNADQMLYPDGEIQTAHSKFPVPFILVSPDKYSVKQDEGIGLDEVAPSVLRLLDIEQPEEMTGLCLIDKIEEDK